MKKDFKNFAKENGMFYEEEVENLIETVFDIGLVEKVRLMPDTHKGKINAWYS